MTDPQIFVDHHRTTGRIICQICCESKEKSEMEPATDFPGKVWDICKECAKAEGGEW
jgi:hypothetical protein